MFLSCLICLSIELLLDDADEELKDEIVVVVIPVVVVKSLVDCCLPLNDDESVKSQYIEIAAPVAVASAMAAGGVGGIIGITMVESAGLACSTRLARPRGQATTGALPSHSLFVLVSEEDVVDWFMDKFKASSGSQI